MSRVRCLPQRMESGLNDEFDGTELDTSKWVSGLIWQGDSGLYNRGVVLTETAIQLHVIRKTASTAPAFADCVLDL